ncbi:MAG: glutamate 5-kinase [Saprospiraceae bacterium]|jgi:glutamate 5-kinase
MSHSRKDLRQAKVWVIKVGSALLTQASSGLNLEVIATLASQIAFLRSQGKQVVLVSSGSIAEGSRKLGWNKRPKEIHKLQAAAAVGQMGLVHQYQQAFNTHRLTCAQILLTNADLANRKRYLNARSTLTSLLDLNVIPIVNENDTVVTDEIRFGDNDTLAALVANIVGAEVLVLLTDQKGLFTADPSKDKTAKLIEQGIAGDPRLDAMAGDTSEFGTGGMVTKLKAATKAAHSGASTVIAFGKEPEVLKGIYNAKNIGTCLFPSKERLSAKKQWLAGQTQSNGKLVLDKGAARVLREKGSSLLPIGVTGVTGEFGRGDIVLCVDVDGKDVARGLANYSSDEADLMKQNASADIEKLIGYVNESELIHRDNMVIC